MNKRAIEANWSKYLSEEKGISHGIKYQKYAFTLAEVLITLAIIGVVAAMTLPTLISNHQKQTYVTGLKKAVNIAQNMLKKMQADEEASSVGATKLFSEGICERVLVNDNGETVNGNGCEDFYGNPSVFEAIVPKYLKVVKICKGEDCKQLYRTGSFNCSNNNCTLRVSSGSGRKPCSITNVTDVCPALQGFYTEDGMIFYIYPASPGINVGARIEFLVDVNGEKGPNVLNRDLFEFGLDANGKLSKNPYVTEGVFVIMQNGWKMNY